MTAAELVETVRWPTADRVADVVVVDVREDPAAAAPAGLADALAAVPSVFVALTGTSEPPAAGSVAAALDVAVADQGELPALAASPIAATALALLLRGGDGRSVGDGLVAESATYSALQAGPEHRTWLASRIRRERAAEAGPAVRVERENGRLLLTLARPHVRNAFDARMREDLLAALEVAAADPSIEEVVVAGEGPSFCSGGDLDEFGTAPDPATAHLVRVGRSAGRALHRLTARVTVQLHGACVGAGIELPAFASHVVAAADASFRLPEVAMGLVPGAGGTVSIPRRIGRQRTMWLALSGSAIDAETALRWGLVDEVTARP